MHSRADTVARARLIAKVLTFVADALESAVTPLRTPAANDPVEAPAPAASDKPVPSATEMEEAPASVVPIFGGGCGPDTPDQEPRLGDRRDAFSSLEGNKER
jgi:hypothetical protein